MCLRHVCSELGAPRRTLQFFAGLRVSRFRETVSSPVDRVPPSPLRPPSPRVLFSASVVTKEPNSRVKSSQRDRSIAVARDTRSSKFLRVFGGFVGNRRDSVATLTRNW